VVTLVLALVTLVGIAAYGASREPKVQSVMALDARDGRVAFSVGHEVLVADEDGRLLFPLMQATGKPWIFDEVSSVALADTGEIFVADATRRALLRFERDGRRGEAVSLKDPPYLSFESASFGPRLIIADTMAHQLRLVDDSGRTSKSRRIRYPNGITALQTGAQFRWIVAETGMVRARAFTADLEPSDYEPVKTLNAILERKEGSESLLGTSVVPRWSELLDLTVTPKALAAAVCRDDSGDCSVLWVDGETHRGRVVGDVGFVKSSGAEDSDGILKVSEIALTSTGRVLVASPRFSVILSFSGPDGGAPPGGFCRECTRAELEGSPAGLDDLGAGLNWPNGARVSIFGDDEIRRRFQQKRSERNMYVAMQRWGQRGTAAIGVLLLIAFGLMRQVGVDQRARKTGQRQLASGDGRVLVPAVAIIGLAAAAGALLGWMLIGWGGAVGGAAGLGGIAGRFVAVPLLLRGRRPEAASNAFEKFLGPDAKAPLALAFGEKVCWVRFASQRVHLKQSLEEIRDLFSVEDPLEALERLLPKLVLAIATNQRLVLVRASLWGTPLGVFHSFGWEAHSSDPSPAPSSLEVISERLVQQFQLASNSSGAARVRTRRPLYLCDKCRRALGACPHPPARRWVAAALSLVLPGLGHLAQGRFRAARLAAVAGIGLLSQALQAYAPQHWGIIPANPAAYETPMLAYVALLITTLIESQVLARRDEQRRESNRRELTRAGGPA